ncbi:hypothetical protein J7L05_08620 [bacterium]|nr:hypothetical protein [bacterium]
MKKTSIFLILLLCIIQGVIQAGCSAKTKRIPIVDSTSEHIAIDESQDSNSDALRTLSFSEEGITRGALYDGLLAFMGNQLISFRALYGRDPESIEEFLDSPGTLFWPINPFTNEPFEYAEQISEDISSFGKLSLVEYEGKKWIASVIPQDEEFVYCGYPLPKDIEREANNPHYLSSNPYPLSCYSPGIWDELCGTYALMNERLPTSIEELLTYMLIIKENWPDMSNLNSVEDEGYVEIGICEDVINENEEICKMTRNPNPVATAQPASLYNYYYQLVNIPGMVFRGKCNEYGSPGYESQFSYAVTCQWTIGKNELENLVNRMPLVSSVIFPNSESLPDEICISKEDIL